MHARIIAKRNVLIVAIGGVIVMFLVANSWKTGLCARENYDCAFSMVALAASLFIFIPTMFFSLVTYFMREEVFQSWAKFAIWWVPLTVLLTMAAPNDASQSLPMPSTKGIIDIGMILIFIIASFVIIVTKRAALKRWV